jgi:hypothetical protein
MEGDRVLLGTWPNPNLAFSCSCVAAHLYDGEMDGHVSVVHLPTL